MSKADQASSTSSFLLPIVLSLHNIPNTTAAKMHSYPNLNSIHKLKLKTKL